jgi:putative FmdB family regulatory protein
LPIYEFKCSSCKKVFEAYKRVTEHKESEKCPHCSSDGIKIGFSIFSTKLSGTGSGSCGSKGSPFG